MYVLWKTGGTHLEPWRADVRLGAVRDGEDLLLSLAADQPWKGRILFDTPRHRTIMHLPMDYPRINQFPEWFTVEVGRRYSVRDAAGGLERTLDGREMQAGVAVELVPGQELRWRIRQVP